MFSECLLNYYFVKNVVMVKLCGRVDGLGGDSRLRKIFGEVFGIIGVR